MLDSETKSRIDTARDILVGKIPNPQAQVEQITIAMIYKFMDDMDRQVEEAGGKRKFFSGSYSRYSWQHLMSPKLGGLEVLNLYSDAIQKMDLNPNIPPLFREIFKNAYLPYKDPETLRSFLKTINGFTYDHSERLGDAFEYLLSILGSQGDAGQFRTPRHIIDFMVYITDPQKGETILDPACGTAGFLISSYKHILKNNSSEYLKKIEHSFSFGSENGENCSGDKLTPDDRRKLPKNIRGYDISPDMVRLSLVNLYLHGFAEPNIFEYDTLTSEDKWNEYYNVILANPPFMSPKGGIRPHKRFSIESNRSEVLFVDYIAEHLTQFGRAAVIVPEGIIFQSGTAYKALRKMLVENHLYAVVSLPAGVFNPYSGVKTSILLMDKTLSKRTENILFAKVENDGFDLGAQRRANTKGELPETAKAIKEYKESLITGKSFPVENYPNLLLAPKSKISASGDHNLSGERYREVNIRTSQWPLCELGEVSQVTSSKRILAKEYVQSGIPFYRTKEIVELSKGNDISLELFISRERYVSLKAKFGVPLKDDLLVSAVGTIGISWIVSDDRDFYFKDGNLLWVRNLSKINPIFLKLCLDLIFSQGINNIVFGAAYKALTIEKLKKFQIPLPPLEVQKEIVAEIEGYQKIIDGARQIVDNYKPRITIDPKWEVKTIGEFCEVKGGKRIPKGENFSFAPTDYPYIRVTDFREQSIYLSNLKYISKKTYQIIKRYTISSEDVYISIAGTIGLMGTIPVSLNGANLTENAAKLVFNQTRINKYYLSTIGNGKFVQKQIRSYTHSVGVPKLAIERLKLVRIPLPPLEVQKEIVARLEREQELVNANKELIKIFESKIKSKISSVWGEEESL